MTKEEEDEANETWSKEYWANVRAKAFDASPDGTLLATENGWLVRVNRNEEVIERIRPLSGWK